VPQPRRLKGVSGREATSQNKTNANNDDLSKEMRELKLNIDPKKSKS